MEIVTDWLDGEDFHAEQCFIGILDRKFCVSVNHCFLVETGQLLIRWVYISTFVLSISTLSSIIKGF